MHKKIQLGFYTSSKIQFKIDLKSSSSNLIFPTWFFKNQVQKLHKAKIVSFEPAAAVRSAGGAPPPFHIKKEKLYGRWTFWPGTPALSKNTALPDPYFHPLTNFPSKVPNYEVPNISFKMQSVKIKTSSEPSLLLLVFFLTEVLFYFQSCRTGVRAAAATAAQSFRKIPTALRYIQLCFLVKEWGVLSCCQSKSF